MRIERPTGGTTGERLARIEAKLELLLARKAVLDGDEAVYEMPLRIPEKLLVPYGAWQTNMRRRVEAMELRVLELERWREL